MKGESARNDHAGAPLVTGQIVIASGTPAFDHATVYVHLEDISYANAAASVVAETISPNARHPPSHNEMKE
jgi:hypothetical protein